ncbi:phospholipase [Catenuloplanes atrovinosus]|uniref:Opacity protein-like surface antigen n=1 Tax=Catenuloplanes atrovinosus TaxID=137266 RepID=A0AAE3YXF2_9ACTN|nr:phospholipase [Catenuloplanes atrovinosus]MDR7280562.1 opacity protein-like surface antigen [Catenuloplanes atrovinosus]
MPLSLSADINPTVKRVGTVLVALLAVLAIASPAAAAVTPEQKAATLSSFTQTSVASYNAWNSARQNQGAWAEYGFDWSTDYCSSSPDNPLGFDFTLSCYRHDFGYRNYKAAGTFAANKSRLDSAFYEDLKRKCATYSSATRPACYSLAWVYYEAVVIFGSVSAVKQSDLDEAARLKAQGLKAEANAA